VDVPTSGDAPEPQVEPTIEEAAQRETRTGGSTGAVARAGVFMVFAAATSRMLGMVREMVLSHQFGQGRWADIYNAAFMVPDLLFMMLSSGALASVFVPIFTRYLEKGDRERAWYFFSNATTLIGLGISALIVLMEIFVVPLTAVANWGFPRDKVLEVAALTRIVLPAQLCFFIGSILISVQYAHKKFTVPAMASIVYNLTITAFGLVLGNPITGLGPAGFSWGALTGAVLGNLVLQMWGVKRLGGHYRPIFNWRDPDVKKFVLLMVPIVFTISLPQVDMEINKFFSTFLPGDGGMASLNYANRLMQMPLGILAQASAIVVFPYFATQAARGDMDALKRSINRSIRAIVTMTVPASVLMIVLAEPIVRVVYQRGRFVPADTMITAKVLIFYCIGIAAWSAQGLLARGFYALQDTARPMITGSVVTVVFIGLNALLIRIMQANGLALSTSLAAILLAVALFFQLQKRVGGMNGSQIVFSFLKVGLAAAVMAGPVYGVRRLITQFFDPVSQSTTALSTMEGLILVFAGALVGGLVYAGMLTLLRVEEMGMVQRQVTARLRRA